MKGRAFLKKNVWLLIALLLALSCVIFFLWWRAPVTFLEDVNPVDVSYIFVFNGNTGNSFRVENGEDIAYIVTNIQSIEMRKEKRSANVDGFLFSLSFYGQNGELIDAFIVNEGKLRDDPFFYTFEEGTLCTDKLWALEKGLAE